MGIKVGKFNQLEVLRKVDFGVYLEGGDDNGILLPARYVPEGCSVGDVLNVFVYFDSEERLVATTLAPLAQVGDFACLEVSWVNRYGAFLNWGLMKDLFVPFREQRTRMQVGERHIVHVHIDEETGRIMASAKVEHYLSKGMPEYADGELVHILVWKKTDLGYKAIVDNRYGGLLYQNEIFSPIEVGMSLQAYVKQVREDGKIDLVLQRGGFHRVKDFADVLLAYLKEHGGYAPLHDKSEADEIYAVFGVSKKTFKKAVGDLYKKRLIVLEERGIALNGRQEGRARRFSPTEK